LRLAPISAIDAREIIWIISHGAVELLPLEKDAIDAAIVRQYLAAIYAWSGEKDLGFKELPRCVSIPGRLTYGQLRLDPMWEPLRSDARFERIVASLAPK
jgi:hypothetical protein